MRRSDNTEIVAAWDSGGRFRCALVRFGQTAAEVVRTYIEKIHLILTDWLLSLF